MNTRYEWDAEQVAVYASESYEEGEVIEHHFADSLKEARQTVRSRSYNADAGTLSSEGYELVLVRDDDGGRSWAYMENGKLPTHFRDAFGSEGARVPQRFHREVEKAS